MARLASWVMPATTFLTPPTLQPTENKHTMLQHTLLLVVLCSCTVLACDETASPFSNHCELDMRCRCPWSTCKVDDGHIFGECKATGTLLGVFIVVLIAVVVASLICSWLCCCKGVGCSFTALCKGGCCCTEAPEQTVVQQQPHPIVGAFPQQQQQPGYAPQGAYQNGYPQQQYPLQVQAVAVPAQVVQGQPVGQGYSYGPGAAGVGNDVSGGGACVAAPCPPPLSGEPPVMASAPSAPTQEVQQ